MWYSLERDPLVLRPIWVIPFSFRYLQKVRKLGFAVGSPPVNQIRINFYEGTFFFIFSAMEIRLSKLRCGLVKS